MTIHVHRYAFTTTLPFSGLLGCLRRSGSMLEVGRNWLEKCKIIFKQEKYKRTSAAGTTARPRVRVDGPAAVQARASFPSVLHDAGSLRLRVTGVCGVEELTGVSTLIASAISADTDTSAATNVSTALVREVLAALPEAGIGALVVTGGAVLVF